MKLMKNTLLCWQSVNHGDDVLRNAISLLNSKGVVIESVFLLKQHDMEIGIQIDNVCVHEVLLDIGADPTDHLRIYEAIKELVIPQLSGVNNLNINVSPGTPAMHAIWLILHAGGRFPNGTKLWSTQFNPNNKQTYIKPVNFAINTYLSEIITLQHAKYIQAIYDVESNSDIRRKALLDVQKFARLPNVTLLISGERGIGKTRLVETIIKTVKQKEIITVNGSELNTDNAEFLLFGKVSGNDQEDVVGLLDRANENTLLIDEIQDLSKKAQKILVCVLQGREKRFRKLGAIEEEKVEFDLVCTTSRSIDELEGLLEPDFLEKISLLTVSLPALRECREDILGDWQKVWEEMRMLEVFPDKAPMDSVLEHFLLTAAFSENFRDLQRLACLIMAYWESNNVSQSITDALCVMDNDHNPMFTSTGAVIVEGKTRAEMLSQFRKELALNAKERYGTWRKAADALMCDEKTLRQDAALEI